MYETMEIAHACHGEDEVYGFAPVPQWRTRRLPVRTSEVYGDGPCMNHGVSPMRAHPRRRGVWSCPGVRNSEMPVRTSEVYGVGPCMQSKTRKAHVVAIV